jgi:methyl-accepting chemotaxis protein
MHVASDIITASHQLSIATDQLASGTQTQAFSLDETAAAIEQITGTVRQNADSARQANQFAMSSREVAERGGHVVTAAVGAMDEIHTAPKKVVDIIATISEIAFQTNLLALNTAVEAARAGQQGRGFAVVAAEVRNLAQRAAMAGKEIKTLISNSVQKVESGAELVGQSGRALGEIVTVVKRVTDIIAEMAATSQEQSQGMGQVGLAVTQMDQIVRAHSSQTEELASTAQALIAQASRLQELLSQFRLSVTDAAAARPYAPLVETAHGEGAMLTSHSLGPAPSPTVAAQKRGKMLSADVQANPGLVAVIDDGIDEL